MTLPSPPPELSPPDWTRLTDFERSLLEAYQQLLTELKPLLELSELNERQSIETSLQDFSRELETRLASYRLEIGQDIRNQLTPYYREQRKLQAQVSQLSQTLKKLLQQ